MKSVTHGIVIAGLLFLVGCAHPITVAPSMTSLENKTSVPKIKKTVGYYISAENRALSVVTPGGGGDEVEYSPYKDLEPGIYRVLFNVFTDVQVLKSRDDKNVLAAQKIDYVFVPTIRTSSSSESPFTWPPTKFSVTLQCLATSPGGEKVWETTVNGEGAATFDEFKEEFGLSARRASEDALQKLEKALRNSPLK